MAFLDYHGLQTFWDNLKGHVNFYGVCSTTGEEKAKTVSIPHFKLTTGARVTIKFTEANAVKYPTLNVSDTGEKPIVGPTGVIDTDEEVYVLAGYCDLLYDGENWVLLSGQLSATNQIVYTGNEAPSNPVKGMVWLKKMNITN